MSSEEGDYVGAGSDYEFSGENGIMSVRGDSKFIQIQFEGDDHWGFVFSGARGAKLKVGTFSSAQRAGMGNQVRPGVSVSGAGRGCNRLTGKFVVKDIGFTESGRPETFVADFEQYCAGSEGKLSGEVDVRIDHWFGWH